MTDEQKSNPLKNELIEITNIELVDKGKAPNTWKEYDVKIKDYVKGTKYSLPLKKANGETTKAYEFYKTKLVEWSEIFADGNSVLMNVAISEKSNDWTYEGKTGTTIYKTIRFMEEPSEADELLASKTDDEVPVEDIKF